MLLPKTYDLLVLNSELPALDEVKQLHKNAARIIAADGGANRLMEIGLKAGLVVGDFDSLNSETRALFSDAIFVEDPDQNTSDFEKALERLRAQGTKRVCVLGMNGGRFDHQTINLSVATRYAQFIEIWYCDSDGQGMILSAMNQPLTKIFKGEPKQLISLVGLPVASGVSTEGLNWELKDAELRVGNFDSLSNYYLGNEVTVSLQSGRILVYFPRQLQP